MPEWFFRGSIPWQAQIIRRILPGKGPPIEFYQGKAPLFGKEKIMGMFQEVDKKKAVEGLVEMIIVTIENKMDPAQLKAFEDLDHEIEMMSVTDNVVNELIERILSLVEAVADRAVNEINMILTPKAHLRSDHFMGIIGDCPRPHIER